MRKQDKDSRMRPVVGYDSNLQITYATKRSTFQANKRDHNRHLYDRQNLDFSEKASELSTGF